MAKTIHKREQIFAFVVSVCFCVFLSAVFLIYGYGLFRRPHNIRLDDRINPNSAPVASLVRLPNVGLVRAEALAVYREELAKKDNDRLVFKTAHDLQKVSGIGPKTVQSASQWLKFE